MTKRVKYKAICKEWKLINLHLRSLRELCRRGIEIGFQRLRVFVCNCSAIVTPQKALFYVISPLGNLVIAYRTNLLVIEMWWWWWWWWRRKENNRNVLVVVVEGKQ